MTLTLNRGNFLVVIYKREMHRSALFLISITCKYKLTVFACRLFVVVERSLGVLSPQSSDLLQPPVTSRERIIVPWTMISDDISLKCHRQPG